MGFFGGSGKGLFGLGGMGGMQPSMPKGLLDSYYDPAEVRKAQIKSLLLGMGTGLLSQGPSDKPINFMTSMGQGLAKGVESARQTGDEYRNVAMQGYQMQTAADDRSYGREQDEKKFEYGMGRDRADDERANRAFEYGMNRDGVNDKFKVQEMEIQRQKASQQGGPEYGLNPVWLQNSEGKWMLVQPSKDGSAPRPMQFPDGFNPAPQNRTVDTGTGYVTMPTRGDGGPTGGVIQKDLEGEAAAKKLGADQGENLALLRSMNAKLPGLEKVVTDLESLADRATYTGAGQLYNDARKQFGLDPSDGAVARTQYVATVANQVLPLLRDTFGAQFTAAEGERLLATLGNPDVTPPEKKAVLRSFIQQKKRDIEGLSVQTGQQPPQGGNGGNNDPLGIR